MAVLRMWMWNLELLRVLPRESQLEVMIWVQVVRESQLEVMASLRVLLRESQLEVMIWVQGVRESQLEVIASLQVLPQELVAVEQVLLMQAAS